jgi:hypothetical protein
MAWCPKVAMYRSTVVSVRRRNLYYTDECVEPVETIEKAATLVYSTDSGIFLNPKDVPKTWGESLLLQHSPYCQKACTSAELHEAHQRVML